MARAIHQLETAKMQATAFALRSALHRLIGAVAVAGRIVDQSSLILLLALLTDLWGLLLYQPLRHMSTLHLVTLQDAARRDCRHPALSNDASPTEDQTVVQLVKIRLNPLCRCQKQCQEDVDVRTVHIPIYQYEGSSSAVRIHC